MPSAEFDGWPTNLSHRRVLVVNPLRASWSLGFCAEAALRARQTGAEVLWFDAPNVLGRDSEGLQVNRQDKWKSRVYRDPLVEARLELAQSGVLLANEAEYAAGSAESREPLPRFRTLRSLDEWTWSGLALGASVHASVSGQIFRKYLDLQDRSVSREVRRQCRIAIRLACTYRRIFEAYQPEVFFTTNDRILPAAVALLVARAAGVDSYVSYFGSASGRITTLEGSLYSQSAWSNLLDLNTTSMLDAGLLEKRGRDAVAALRATDAETSGVDFRKRMEPGRIPARSRTMRAVVFPGTPWEMSAVANLEEGEEGEGQFRDQEEAVGELLSLLDQASWEVVLRHHPPHPLIGDVSERDAWQHVTSRSNVVEVLPDSPVDSLELAEDADLCIVWNSTIGLNLLARHLPTIVCGPIFWAKDEWGLKARNRDELERILTRGPTFVAESDLWPAAAFMSDFGSTPAHVAGLDQELKVKGQFVFVPRLYAGPILRLRRIGGRAKRRLLRRG